MMKRRPRILIENGLAPVRDLLRREGYDVGQLGEDERGSEGIASVDAFVISGVDVNFMGRSDIISKVPVISANGRTPEEVLARLRERIGSP